MASAKHVEASKRKLAKKKDNPGRSQMGKWDLVRALRRSS
jgi:hypothetical protein